MTPGTFTWGGAWGSFLAEPVGEHGRILMPRSVYGHINVRTDFGVTAMQSIVDSSRPAFHCRAYPKLD